MISTKFVQKLRLPATLLGIGLLVASASFVAAQTIPGLVGGNRGGAGIPAVNTLPRIRSIVQGVAGLEKPAANRLIVRQNEPKAILHWNSFDIGANAATHFDQKGNSDWAALNRIFDKNPSMILGKLSGDGKIYLINQNGTLFGPSAKVNVHTLIASSLDVKDDEFLNNLLKFKGDNLAGKVVNYGQLTAKSGGSVFLVGPEVENAGIIITPSGQIGLIAGTEVDIAFPEGQTRLFPFVYVGDSAGAGEASNAETGVLEAEGGLAGLYGRIVNQDGIIKSLTAISNNGRIELHAADKVVTGPNSVTASPISEDPERVHQSFAVQGGEIHIAGLEEKDDSNKNVETATQRVEHQGLIAAPSGSVDILAEERVHLSRDSKIDVSGEWVERDVDSTIISAQLNSVELKNDFGQKGGVLQGETVTVNPQTGSSIGDLSGALNFEFLTAREKSTAGGKVNITAPTGEIIIRQGAAIDFSGGGRTVLGETVNSTLLVSGNRVYDISSAPQWIDYDRILDRQERVFERYGITETFTGIYAGGAAPVNNRRSSFIEGDDAGELSLKARGIVLDGKLDGSAVRGLYQTELKVPEVMVGNFAIQQSRGNREPRGGRLEIGGEGLAGITTDFITDEIVITRQTDPLPETFGADDKFVEIVDLDGELQVQPLAVAGQTTYQSDFSETRYWNASQNRFATQAEFSNPGDDDIHEIEAYPLFRTTLSAEKLNAAGLSRLDITSNTWVDIQPDTEMSLTPGGLRIFESSDFRQGIPLEYQDTSPAFLNIRARAIKHAGQIKIPAGRIDLTVVDAATSPARGKADTSRNIDEDLLPHRIILSDGSLLDVSGDRLTNDLTGFGNSVEFGHLAGGSVALVEGTQFNQAAVVIAPAATVDVSGGYERLPSGDLIGADAGSIFVRAASIALEGNLKGYSLQGQQGGAITLRAETLQVAQPGQRPALGDGFAFNDPLPNPQKLILADNQLNDTGITRITLQSEKVLDMAPNTHLKPSNVKLREPAPSENDLITEPISNRVHSQYESGPSPDTFRLPDELLENTSITLQAALSGTTISTDAVILPQSAVVEAFPRGHISLSGKNVDLAGTLIAPAGSVSVRAQGLTDDQDENDQDVDHQFFLRSSARILAGGLVVPGNQPFAPGLPPDVEVYDGGSVSLFAADNLTIETGARVDVSGTQPVARYLRQADNSYEPVTTAGAGGNISLQFNNAGNLDVRLMGQAHAGVKGGGLTVSHIREKIIDGDRLVIGEDASARDSDAPDMPFFDLTRADGFADMKFETLQNLVFAESNQNPDGVFDLAIGGQLTLDAPLITATFQEEPPGIDALPSEGPLAELRLGANVLILANSNAKYGSSELFPSAIIDLPLQAEPGSGAARFQASAGWIDVNGSVAFPGFREVSLSSKSDIRLSDEKYDVQTDGGTSQIVWRGALRAPDAISLESVRLYPTSRTDFTISTASENGHIKFTRPENAPTDLGPLYSAGGTLRIHAPEIDHQGYLAAPLGQIIFAGNETDPSETIVLSDGSVTTTRGEIPVRLGELADIFWSIRAKPTDPARDDTQLIQDVEAVPEKTIRLEADNAVIRSGALLDASGSGEIFSYEFIPGTDGLADPFLQDGRYVIVPGITQPGPAVTLLEGAGGLAAGTYPLLPAEFAFVPGAYVIEEIGQTDKPFARQLSTEGYAVVAGYESEFNAAFRSALPTTFSIRDARDVFLEGNFNVRSLTAGEGGRIELLGNTTILDGVVQGDSLAGFSGGAFAVSGGESAIVRFAASIPDDLKTFEDIATFLAADEDRVAPELAGKANVRAEGLSRKGLEEISIGTLTGQNPTQLVLVEDRAELETPLITLAAQQRITLSSGSELLALGEGGAANLKAPVIIAEENSLIRASDAVHLDTGVNPEINPLLILDGRIAADNSTLSLRADRISITPDGTGDASKTLYLADTLTGFSGFEHLQLKADTAMSFAGGVRFGGTEELHLAALELDTPLITGDLNDGRNAMVEADRISLSSAEFGEKTDGQYNAIAASLADDAVFDEDTATSISFTAPDGIEIGPGHLQFSGFNRIELATSRELSTVGQRSISAGGELNLAAARLTARPYTQADPDRGFSYEVADYTINAGRVDIQQRVGKSDAPLTPGGRLTILADSIRHGGTIEMLAGQIKMAARDRGTPFGGEGIYLGEQARLWSPGGVLERDFAGEKLLEFHRGGTITLQAQAGDVEIQTNAELDIANSTTAEALTNLAPALRDSVVDSGLLDAGTITLAAETGNVILDGVISGAAGVGRGGSLTLDTGMITTDQDSSEQGALTGLSQKLADGGFDNRLNIRVREQSLLIDADDTVTADIIRLRTDSGGIDVKGALDASDADAGGRIELLAGADPSGTSPESVSIRLHPGSSLDAGSESGDGGEIWLSAAEGALRFESGASIDVSGGSQGTGGTVRFRARRTAGDDDGDLHLFGDITGAADITAAGVLDVTDQLSGGPITAAGLQSVLTSQTEFTVAAESVSAAIAGNSHFRYIPEFEIDAAGDLEFTGNIDLTSVRYTVDGTRRPGALTVNASGKITLAGNLVDHPTALDDLNVEVYDPFEAVRSWDLNLTAGTDLAIGDHLIYTENGRLQFAAGNDVTIGGIVDAEYMINNDIGYNLATYAGDIRGRAGRDMILDGGAVQSALGDIEIGVGRNLELDLTGGSAIRTTGIGTFPGILPDTFKSYTEFEGGGAITIEVGNHLTGNDLKFLDTNKADRHLEYWANIYSGVFEIGDILSWSADYGGDPPEQGVAPSPTAGIATMADGDIRLTVGGNFDGQVGTFKTGDITLISNGNFGGFFQLADGAGFIDAMGSVPNKSNGIETSLAMLHGHITMAAQGSIDLGTIFNPTMLESVSEYTDTTTPQNNLTYSSGAISAPTSVRLAASHGDVTLTGQFKAETEAEVFRVLPPVLEIEAGRGIHFYDSMALAPAASGNLKLIAAGGSISGIKPAGLSRSEIYISDLNPAATYFAAEDGLVLSGLTRQGSLDLFANPELESAHANIHLSDPNPVMVLAAGDIEEIELFSPKPARIMARGDIRGVHYIGQNLNPDDLTSIRAVGDIRMASSVSPVSSPSDNQIESTGYIFNGPGRFLVQAGQSIDLGISRGLQATGNSFNSRLGIAEVTQSRGALYVMAGLFWDDPAAGLQWAPAEIQQFFSELQDRGELFSELRAAGELDQAESAVALTDREVIEPFFRTGLRGEGNIYMTSSQISSTGKTAKAFRAFDEDHIDVKAEYEESADLYIVAGGNANVGLTAIPDPTTIVKETDSGIFTAEGGEINIFTIGDLNVNESRVMTFRGGDVLVYSQLGNINAGRGSKTAINAGSPAVENRLEDGIVVGKILKFEPPSVGSGIRTLTYDPDGFLGPQKAPLAGDGFLFAPRGIIDAGEAGIATRNLTLGATEVVNAQNIDVGGVSVGVPQSSTDPSIGALAGAGSMAEASQIAEESSAMRSAQEKMDEFSKELSESLVPKWISVEVIDFD